MTVTSPHQSRNYRDATFSNHFLCRGGLFGDAVVDLPIFFSVIPTKSSAHKVRLGQKRFLSLCPI